MKYLAFHVSPPWNTKLGRRVLVSDTLRHEFMEFLAGFHPVYGFMELDSYDSSLEHRFGFQDNAQEFTMKAIFHYFKMGYNQTFFLPQQQFPFEALSHGFIKVIQNTKFVFSPSGLGNEVLLETGLEISEGQSSLDYKPDKDFRYRENQANYAYQDEIKAAFELLEEIYAT